MTQRLRLEPEEVQQDGPSVRITALGEDPDVMLEFKSDESAASACRSIRNYLEVVDVEPTDESVMHMLGLLLGNPDDAERDS